MPHPKTALCYLYLHHQCNMLYYIWLYRHVGFKYIIDFDQFFSLNAVFSFSVALLLLCKKGIQYDSF